MTEPLVDPTAAPAAAEAPSGAVEAASAGIELAPAGIELAPGYELPTARQVVGRGLQLAYDSTRDIRRASLYIGLLLLAVLGPLAVLFVVDLPRLGDLATFTGDTNATDPAAIAASRLLVPLVFGGFAAFIGAIAVSFDGQLLVVALLASRAVGRPLTLRESLQRARQVFWRYAFAAFIVGAISIGISSAIGYSMGTLGQPRTFGASLLSTLVSATVNLPFGYILAATVIGDVNGAVALSRSIVLARARPRLALAVAAFAFLAGAIQTFGLGAALDVAAEVGQVLHLDLDPSGSGILLLVPLLAVALVALGSLTVTVGAIAAAPQVAAFLGLTHYAAGLDLARVAPAGSPAPAPPLTDAVEVPAVPVPEPTAWARSAEPKASVGTRWVTRPMAALIVLGAIVSAISLLANLG